MTEKIVALVTGANKGIGREIAAQLAELGHVVVIGSRDAVRGERAAEELRANGADATAVQLDVTDSASVAAAATAIGERHGRLDALVNNAGVARPPGFDLTAQRPQSADLAAIRAIFETNVFGIITVTNAMLPLLRRSSAPRIVNVSSSSGSLTARSDPDVARRVYEGLDSKDLPAAAGYVPSKAALNALTLMYAQDLAPDGIAVNAVDPGYTATDLNNHSGHRSPAQGAVAAVAMATARDDRRTGTFTDDRGTVPW